MVDGLLASALMAVAGPQVRVESGVLEGALDGDLRTFKGVPFAAPPVGDLRWREPKPPLAWTGVRPATEFGSRPMQLPVFGDMVWRSPGMSEDCLYLNVWAPKVKTGAKRLPVLVYFYGGGFVAGSADEPRYDGAAMARQGIVAVTVNYRLGPFGFFAHPELTAESPHRASGNYGLLDQSAALAWVRRNIAAFGGDPKRVTIGGESAGSFSVSAQMASPLSRGLIAGGIGESGAFFGTTLGPTPREEVEADGVKFASELGAKSLADLRALPAERILNATGPSPFRFGATVDGYFLPKSVPAIYASGEQARVPLLAGWNLAESGADGLLGRERATPENLAAAVRRLYGERADEVIRAYRASTDAEAEVAARDLASDRFIGYGTWKWTDLHARTGGRPVFRYLYAQPRPGQSAAHHADEIEYALGNLDLNPVYQWTDDDRKTSATMVAAFANFIRRGDPNGAGVPRWPAIRRGGAVSILRFAPVSRAEPDRTEARYRALDRIVQAPR